MLNKHQLATAKVIKIPTLVQKKLKLKRGQKLGAVEGETGGRQDEEDSYRCDIIDAKGLQVGTVTYIVTRSRCPPKQTSYWLLQEDLDETAIVDTRW